MREGLWQSLNRFNLQLLIFVEIVVRCVVVLAVAVTVARWYVRTISIQGVSEEALARSGMVWRGVRKIKGRQDVGKDLDSGASSYSDSGPANARHDTVVVHWSLALAPLELAATNKE
jgi:hypothetical protein